MSVSMNSAGIVIMDGNCAVEEAEPLLQLLQQFPSPRLDWTHCTGLHTAVLQVIMAARPVLTGACGDRFVAEWVRDVSAGPRPHTPVLKNKGNQSP